MSISPTTTISEIAIQLPYASRVFENLNIDYCCGGEKSLEEACEQAGVSFNRVLEMLETANDQRLTSACQFDPKTDSLMRLVMHILDKHHVFVKRETLRIEELLKKVVTAHGRNHPELNKIASEFRLLCSDLKPHLFKEEQILFPYIVELERTTRQNTRLLMTPAGSGDAFRAMASEHNEVGHRLRELRRLTNDYTVPNDVCLSYEKLYEALQAFEEDLHQHVHLENNILFPRAIALEAERRAAYSTGNNGH